MTGFTTLISAAQLQQVLATTPQPDLVLLDCRADLFDPAAGRAAWAAGHIPGALHADLDTALAAPPHSLPGKLGGRHPLPDPAGFAARCVDWGINRTSQVVAYDASQGAFAARAWWLLRWLGHEQVAVLDGGLSAWQALPGSVVSTDSAAPAPGNFTPSAPITRTASLAAVESLVAEANPRAILVDARASARFDGEQEPIDPVAGHIPGAVCLPHSGNIDDEGFFLSAATLAERFSTISSRDDTDTICYCGSGVTAAHNVLAMRHAGLPEPQLYVGSWSEWCQDPARVNG